MAGNRTATPLVGRTLALLPEEYEAAREHQEPISRLVWSKLAKIETGELTFPRKCYLKLLELEWPVTKEDSQELEIRAPKAVLDASIFVYGRDRQQWQQAHSWTQPLLRFSLRCSLGWEPETAFNWTNGIYVLRVNEDVPLPPRILLDLERSDPMDIRYSNARKMLIDGWPMKRIAAINHVAPNTVVAMNKELRESPDYEPWTPSSQTT